MTSKHVVDKDLGFKRIDASLKQMNGAYTAVGFHKDQKHDKRRVSHVVETDPAPPDVATVAGWLEFGTKFSPKRPFMGMASEIYKSDLESFKAKLVSLIYAGKTSVRRALALLGQRHEDQIKRTMTTGDFAPNSPKTIAAKGSSRPTIDIGQTRQSVRHVETIQGEEIRLAGQLAGAE